MKLSQGRLNQMLGGDEPSPDEMYELIRIYIKFRETKIKVETLNQEME